MSQDVAFAPSSEDTTFKFEAEVATSDSQTETATTETTEDETVSPATDKADVEDSSDEQRVPYSRFHKVTEDRDRAFETIREMEERLASLETARTESRSHEDIEVPPEWVKLYGDSDISKEAFRVQLAREEQLAQRISRESYERFVDEQRATVEQSKENEEMIESSLTSLNEKLGKKLTSKQEEAILDIVDEFSPTGEDGKYTSLFPFDKAYEIYELRSIKKSAPTIKARREVADLSGNASSGEADSNEGTFTRGWDSWRKEV